MAKKDFAHLKHMLEAAHVCLEFAENKNRKDLENDKMLSFAIIRALEIFGEAAANISKPLQQNHSKIQWRAIIGMRNRLIHAYFEIDYDIVWQALQNEIPKLIPELEKILKGLEKEALDA